MAIVATYTSANCPGMPEGCVVHVDDSALEKDQQAAWDRAYAVAFKIYARHMRERRESAPTEERSKTNDNPESPDDGV